MEPASPVTDGEDEHIAPQGNHGSSRHFEGTPLSIKQLAQGASEQGLRDGNLDKEKVASLLENASVFRTPMPKIPPQHLNKARSGESEDAAAMAQAAALWASEGSNGSLSPTQPNLFEVARGQKLQLEEMLRSSSRVATKKASPGRRRSPVTLKLQGQRVSRAGGATPDAGVQRRAHSAKRRARRGGSAWTAAGAAAGERLAAAAAATAEAASGRGKGSGAAEVLQGYKAAKEKNQEMLLALRKDRQQFEELIGAEAGGRREGGEAEAEAEAEAETEEGGGKVAEEGDADAFLERLDQHCQALREAVEEVDGTAAPPAPRSTGAAALERPSLPPLSPPSLASLAPRSPPPRVSGSSAEEEEQAICAGVTVGAGASLKEMQTPAAHAGGAGKAGTQARRAPAVMRTLFQVALLAVAGMLWSVVAGSGGHVGGHVRRLAGLLRVPRSWEEAQVAALVASYELQHAWHESKARAWAAAKRGSLRLSSLLFDLAVQGASSSSAGQEEAWDTDQGVGAEAPPPSGSGSAAGA